MNKLSGERVVLFGCVFVIILAVTFGLSAVVIYGVWNYLVVAAFHTAPITWFQSFVAAICLFVVGGFFKGSSSSK